MTTITQLSEQEYRALALDDPEHRWELWDGDLVEKPSMSMMHDGIAFFLGYLLQSQLDRRRYWVNVNGGKTRRSARTYFIPDVVVIPTALITPFLSDPRALNAFAEPLPFVAEAWSRSTGDYDIAAKLSAYRARRSGDLVPPPL